MWWKNDVEDQGSGRLFAKALFWRVRPSVRAVGRSALQPAPVLTVLTGNIIFLQHGHPSIIIITQTLLPVAVGHALVLRMIQLP